MSETGRIDRQTILRYRNYLRLLADLQFPAALRSKIDPSDAVQETFVRASENADQFRGGTEAEHIAWLRTILTNVLLDEIKKYSTAKRDVHLERSLQENVDGSAARLEGLIAAKLSTPSERAEKCDQLLKLADALETLSSDEREAVQMHHLQGKPLADVAMTLGRTKQAVASLLYRSMNKLKKEMSL